MPIEINTPDKLEYQFFPARGGLFTFKVRSPKDAHLALTPAPEDTGPIYEIFLGGWENTKSVIRKNRQKPEVAQVRTPGILNANEFRGFWVRWYDNVITVGREGTAAALLSYDAGSLFPVKFVGICTGWGASGSWQLDGGYLQSKTELEDWVSELPEEYYSNGRGRTAKKQRMEKLPATKMCGTFLQQQQNSRLSTSPRPILAYWDSKLNTMSPEDAAEVEQKMTKLLWEEEAARK
uniref:C3 and PZP-like alpha-2-macroglobulin domain-containing protein 8 isoform X1 n=1 Tax=Drosophila rhopaloa TaxID=1041015 RepID=A0A6P4EDI8_DRORH